jgi:LemA protein
MKKIIILISVIFISSCGYNKMQKLDEGVSAAWGDLESTLQRRADLIPNLVNTVKGYATHEKDTLSAVIQARSEATGIKLSGNDLSNPQAIANFQKAQGALSSSLSRLLLVVERYPDLKADKHFSDLMNQLEGTENRINVARTRYNDAVKEYNYSIRKFPNNITNSIFLDLKPKEYFRAEERAKEVPEVKF